MSRNFDLLAGVERERESASDDGRVPLSTVHSAAKIDIAPSEPSAEGPELFRLVRSVFLVNNGTSPRRVVFFGVDGESGSSMVCANAARALSRNISKPVCLVDANVRSGRLSQSLGITRGVPVSSKFSSVREQCAQISGNLWLAGIDLMSDGRGCLLPIDELRNRLTQLSGAFEFVIIDAPGIDVSQDAEILGHVADAAVLVIEANKTRRSAAAKAKDSLEAAGVRLLGTVMNDRTFPIPQRLNRFL